MWVYNRKCNCSYSDKVNSAIRRCSVSAADGKTKEPLRANVYTATPVIVATVEVLTVRHVMGH